MNKKIIEASVSELLKEELDEELERRDGEWSAFTQSVFRLMDDEVTQESRMELEELAIAQLKTEVDAELSEMAPNFEEMFRENIEQKIWQSAKEEVTLWTQLRDFFQSIARSEFGYGFGWATAVAAVVMVAVMATPNTPTLDGSEPMAGHVSVESLSFEGTVTLMPDDGVTVIWLDDTPS